MLARRLPVLAVAIAVVAILVLIVGSIALSAKAETSRDPEFRTPQTSNYEPADSSFRTPPMPDYHR